MFSKKIFDTLLSHIPDLPLIIGEESLRHDIDDLVATVFPKMRLCVVDDINTARAFGDKIFSALKKQSGTIKLTLVDGVDADDETTGYIREKSKNCDALIAVGSGTISDICKYSAYCDKKPYLVFPTAASMNGYLSANASINIKGHKTSLKAALPEAVFCDFSAITSAPLRLAKSGFGDSLARPTAQADWLLSYLLLAIPYNNIPFELLKETEGELFDNARGIAAGDKDTIKILFKTLLLSGLGMTIAGGSYPASQSEHMIAHSYHMLKHTAPLPKTLHGEEIAVTSLYMSNLQEKFLHKKTADFAKDDFEKNILEKLFGTALSKEFAKEFSAKQELTNSSRHNLTANNWQNICEEISKIAMPPAQMEKLMKEAKINSTAESIGWNNELFQTACKTARFTRNRFTYLDLH